MKLRAAFLLFLFPLLSPSNFRADSIALGLLSFDLFIPGGGTPRVNGVRHLKTDAGQFDLPPDSPVATGLTLLRGVLTVDWFGRPQSQCGLHNDELNGNKFVGSQICTLV